MRDGVAIIEGFRIFRLALNASLVESQWASCKEGLCPSLVAYLDYMFCILITDSTLKL